MCLYHFKYTGRKHIANSARETVPMNKASVKAMTLPARMAPPDFSSDPSISESGPGTSNNSPTHGNTTTTIIVTSGTNSVGRENLVKGEYSSIYFCFYFAMGLFSFNASIPFSNIFCRRS